MKKLRPDQQIRAWVKRLRRLDQDIPSEPLYNNTHWCLRLTMDALEDLKSLTLRKHLEAMGQKKLWTKEDQS